MEKQKKEADDDVRGRYALPETLELIADDDEDKAEASQKWITGRREFVAEDDAKRRRLTAEFAPLRLSGAPLKPRSTPSQTRHRGRASAIPRSTSDVGETGAASSLRARLLQNTARQSDPFGGQSRRKPPEAKELGVLVRKQ